MTRLAIPSAAVLVGLGLAGVLFYASAPRAPARGPDGIATERARVRVVTMTSALDQPWALAFLPGGDLLITERAGRLRVVHEGRLTHAAIGGIPPVDTRTQDGLMDLALHPR